METLETLHSPSVAEDVAELYLGLLKQNLTRTGFWDSHEVVGPGAARPVKRAAWRLLEPVLRKQRLQLVRERPFDESQKEDGLDWRGAWPSEAETMVGTRRLDNLQRCVTDVIRDAIPGDLIETGVWRGGATILMRAVLKAYGDTTRKVWVADSFEWVPPPDAARYPADDGDKLWQYADVLAAPVDQVKANFARYGLLDDQVEFLVGWFKDTLPTAPIDKLSVLRLDGDLYESTMDALTELYPKLSPGGYLIVDDYDSMPPCREAIADYRRDQGIDDPMERIDAVSVFWRRS
jgi:O-methyltransferase